MTTCKVCGGNNLDMPCAYPSEGIEGCLRLKKETYPRGWEDIITPGLGYDAVEANRFPVGDCNVLPTGILPDSSIADYATVYIDRLPNDNRQFKVRLSGRARDLVEKRAVRYANEIDHMRSPNVACAYKVGDYWYVVVTWYSVD